MIRLRGTRREHYCLLAEDEEEKKCSCLCLPDVSNSVNSLCQLDSFACRMHCSWKQIEYRSPVRIASGTLRIGIRSRVVFVARGDSHL